MLQLFKKGPPTEEELQDIERIRENLQARHERLIAPAAEQLALCCKEAGLPALFQATLGKQFTIKTAHTDDKTHYAFAGAIVGMSVREGYTLELEASCELARRGDRKIRFEPNHILVEGRGEWTIAGRELSERLAVVFNVFH